jgi:hypothetical protein
MANSYQESIDKAKRDIIEIKSSLGKLHEDILQNASAFRNLLQSTGVSNLKEFNSLVAQNNKLTKQNTELKATQVNMLKKAEIAEERLSGIRLTNSKKELDIENKKAVMSNRDAARKKKEEQLLLRSASSYNKLDVELKKVSKDFQDLSAKRAQGITLTTKEIGKLNALEGRLKILGGAYKRVNRELITASGGVNRASTSFDSLGFSVAQITRESPAFINSMNTGFMAISNNIPILVDEINKLNLKNKDLIAQGKPQVNVLKKVGAAFFSWQSLISASIVALTVFGPKIIDFIRNMGNTEVAILSTNDALEKLDDSVKSEIGTIIRLTQRLKDVNISEGERLGIITQLNEKFPEFNSNILKEKDNTKLVNQAIDEYISVKVKQVKARDLENKIVEQTIDLEKSRDKNLKALTELEKDKNIVDNEKLKRAAELHAMDLQRPKLTKDNAAEVNKVLKLEKERNDLLKFLSSSQMEYVNELVNQIKAEQNLSKMKTKLNDLLDKEDELIEGTVENYRKLIAANQKLIIEKKTIKDLDEVRRLQDENKEHQKQIDIILNKQKAKSSNTKKQKDETLELLKIGAEANKKLVEDDERTFSDRTELLDKLLVRRRLINQKTLENDLKAAGKNEDLQKLAQAKFMQRLDKDLQEEQTLRKSIQKDVLDDIKENLKEIEDASKVSRNKEIIEANGDKDKLKEIEKRHFKAVLELQSNYIADVLRENENLTDEQVKILVDMLSKMGAEMTIAADKTISNLKDIQKQFKDIFGTVTDTFSNAFDIDASKFDFVFDELAKGFDNLDETTSKLFDSENIGKWADATKELIGGVLNASMQRFEFEIEASRRTRDTILNDELATEEQKKAARRKFEADERRIKTAMAKKERENTLIQIAVDAAVGVAKAHALYLSNPLTAPALPVVLPFILGSAAVQAAFVASQPLPKFEVGTSNAPEGLAYTDEKGAEIHTDKKGNIKDFGSNKGARIKYLNQGDKILNAAKTKEIMNGLSSSDIQNAVFNMNMRNNGEIIKDNVVDLTLLREISAMKKSNEKVWSEVKKLANRPINVQNDVTLPNNRPY